MTPRQRHRRAAQICAVVVPSLVVAAAVTGGASADGSCVSFGTVAAGDGVRVGVDHTGFVADQADTEGPAAQAVANSRGQSTGYAGTPYPGEAALSGVALGGQDPSALPVYVISQYPTDPSNSKTAGTFELSSASKSTSSSASAKGGGSSDPSAAAGATGATAQAGCDAKGVIASTAVTDAEAVSLAGVLRLGRVHGEAHAVVGADGKTTLSSSLVVGDASVSGQGVEITDKGIQYPGGTQVLPGNPLADALAAADVTVTWIEARKDPDGAGITAPGLQVSVARTLFAAQPTIVTYTFGRGYARAKGDPDEEPAPSPVIDDGGQPRSGTSGDPVTPPATSGGSITPPEGGTSGSGFVPWPAIGNPPPSTAGEPGASAPVRTRAAGATGPLELPLSGLYLALVVAAAAIFAGGYLIRQIGVRLSWT